MKTWQINLVIKTYAKMTKADVETAILESVNSSFDVEKVLDVEASDISKPKPVIASGGRQ